MAVEWQCPKCNGKMYSAWDKHDEKTTTCIYCNYIFENKYYNSNYNKKQI